MRVPGPFLEVASYEVTKADLDEVIRLGQWNIELTLKLDPTLSYSVPPALCEPAAGLEFAIDNFDKLCSV